MFRYRTSSGEEPHWMILGVGATHGDGGVAHGPESDHASELFLGVSTTLDQSQAVRASQAGSIESATTPGFKAKVRLRPKLNNDPLNPKTSTAHYWCPTLDPDYYAF